MKHIKLFEQLFENSEDVISFVSKESYFELDDKDEDSITFITRENGNIMTETPGQDDIKEANRMKALIKSKFGFGCEVEEVDEWVYLKVLLKAEEKNEETFAIFKHIGSLSNPGWRGFGESAKTLEELKARIIHWTNFDEKTADEYIQKLKDAKFNAHDFYTEYVDLKLSSKAMGYDWTIRKRKPR